MFVSQTTHRFQILFGPWRVGSRPWVDGSVASDRSHQNFDEKWVSVLLLYVLLWTWNVE